MVKRLVPEVCQLIGCGRYSELLTEHIDNGRFYTRLHTLHLVFGFNKKMYVGLHKKVRHNFKFLFSKVR